LKPSSSGIDRRVLVSTLALLPAASATLLPAPATAQTAGETLTSWNDGAAKQAILDFVRATTERSSASYVAPEERIATFDQDGTLWVEHPMYTQVVYCLERVPAVVEKRPELKRVEPFKTVLSGNREAIAKLSLRDLEAILTATLTGMSVDEFNAEAKKWLETARHPRWNRLYTELVYQPMLEVQRYLRDNGYRTYIVTGGGQDFVRVYAEKVYGIPPEQVVGTAGGTKFGYGKDGKPFLTKEPKLLLNDNNAGKPEGIHLMIGRRPYAAFGNSTGDREMLEWTAAGAGARLKMLLLHDDATREFAYGPAQGLPESRVGTFTQALFDEAKKGGWTVISMKNDWKRIFSFDRSRSVRMEALLGFLIAIWDPAIPRTVHADLARPILAQQAARPSDPCGWMGVEVSAMTEAFADSLGMAEPYGAIFDQPEPGSPAAGAGIEQGDVLTAINGSPLMRASDFAEIISAMAPGTPVDLDTSRDGDARPVTVILGSTRCGSGG
jgi:phosphoglycolate phosphatase-like HAD superfamily hydrolase